MALSLTERATGRAEKLLAAIRDHLRAGASQRALNRSLMALQSEAAKRRRRDPKAGALLDAEAAAVITGIAVTFHRRKPPRSQDLLDVFAETLERVLMEAGDE